MNWPTLTFLFEPADLWVGAFIDRKKRRLYILPLPTLGIVLSWPVPPPVRCAKPVVYPATKRTVIIAFSFAQAREYATAHHLPSTWTYATESQHMHGYRADSIHLVKLPSWDHGKSREFLDMVRRLEAGL